MCFPVERVAEACSSSPKKTLVLSFCVYPFVLGMAVLTSARTNLEEIGAQLLWRSRFSRRLSGNRSKKKRRIGRLVHLETDLALEAFLAVTVGRSSPPRPGTRIPVRSLEHGMLTTVGFERVRILSLLVWMKTNRFTTKQTERWRKDLRFFLTNLTCACS